tara:strand:+ start:206 stop:424 length:219 start_codon:yes stop_codon:yes gene_type:complete
MFKKGDLVRGYCGAREVNVAVVVKEEYLGTFTSINPVTEKATLTEEKIVVDLMHEGKIFKKIPIEHLQKITK